MKKLILLFIIICFTNIFAEIKEGVGSGYKDDIVVSVKIDKNKIIDIQIKKMEDTKRIAVPAIEKLTSDILQKQSVDVDNVAGATYTSEGFKKAVSDALKK